MGCSDDDSEGSSCKGGKTGGGSSEDDDGDGSVDDVGCGEGSGDDGGDGGSDDGSGGRDNVGKGSDCGDSMSDSGGGELGGGKADANDLRRMDKGVRFLAGTGERPGGEGRGKGSDGWLMIGGDRSELGRLGTEAADVICMAAGIHQGPLGQLEGSGKGGAVKGAWMMKSEAGDGTGEGSTGTTSALAIGFPGDAGAGSKGM